MGAVASAQEREQGPLGFHSSRPHNTAGLRGRGPPQLPVSHHPTLLPTWAPVGREELQTLGRAGLGILARSVIPQCWSRGSTFQSSGGKGEMGCLEEGCRGLLPTHPPQDQESTLFLFTPCLWLEGVTSTAPVYPSSPPLLLHPHIALILGNATHMAKEAATQASRSQATASGIPPDHSPRWEGWIQMKSFSVNPQRRKASGQRGVGGQSVCTSVCVHVYPCLQTGKSCGKTKRVCLGASWQGEPPASV